MQRGSRGRIIRFEPRSYRPKMVQSLSLVSLCCPSVQSALQEGRHDPAALRPDHRLRVAGSTQTFGWGSDDRSELTCEHNWLSEMLPITDMTSLLPEVRGPASPPGGLKSKPHPNMNSRLSCVQRTPANTSGPFTPIGHWTIAPPSHPPSTDDPDPRRVAQSHSSFQGVYPCLAKKRSSSLCCGASPVKISTYSGMRFMRMARSSFACIVM